MTKTVTACYETYATAEHAVADLLQHDIKRDDIRVLVQEALAKDGVRITEEDSRGVATGVGIGAALGGVGGLVLGLTAFPLLAALVGAGVGGAAGGVMGLLTEMGLPEDEAHDYAAGVCRGGVLVMVHAADDVAARAAAVLAAHHPMHA